MGCNNSKKRENEIKEFEEREKNVRLREKEELDSARSETLEILKDMINSGIKSITLAEKINDTKCMILVWRKQFTGIYYINRKYLLQASICKFSRPKIFYKDDLDSITAVISTLYILVKTGGLEELKNDMGEKYKLKITHLIESGRIVLEINDI